MRRVEGGRLGLSFPMAARVLLLSLLLVQVLILALLRTPCSSWLWRRIEVTSPLSESQLDGSYSAKWLWRPTIVKHHHGGESVQFAGSHSQCEGRRVYVYQLPPRFNQELLDDCAHLNPWADICTELSNSGLGPPLSSSPWLVQLGWQEEGPWYGTDQFSGEVLHHARMLHHPCRTLNPELASTFYIPFYAGLDIVRYLWFNSSEQRDALGVELLGWLRGQEYWERNLGHDHFIMIGRISWDFRRSGKTGWGSSFIHMPEMENVTRLAIERNPWDPKEMGVPYPTGFHPRTDAEVVEWQDFVRKSDRDLLFSFAGAPRRKFPHDFRLLLFEQCARSGSCRVLDCSERRCEQPHGQSQAAVNLFLKSVFCLQPRGDSFTRRSIFDSLIAGCIPVFFWNQSAYWQYQWHLPENRTSYSVMIPKDDIKSGLQIEEVLRSFSPEQVQAMQKTVLDLIPRLVYAVPGHRLDNVKDAFDTTVDRVLRRVQSLNLTSAHPLPQLT